MTFKRCLKLVIGLMAFAYAGIGWAKDTDEIMRLLSRTAQIIAKANGTNEGTEISNLVNFINNGVPGAALQKSFDRLEQIANKLSEKEKLQQEEKNAQAKERALKAESQAAKDKADAAKKISDTEINAIKQRKKAELEAERDFNKEKLEQTKKELDAKVEANLKKAAGLAQLKLETDKLELEEEARILREGTDAQKEALAKRKEDLQKKYATEAENNAKANAEIGKKKAELESAANERKFNQALKRLPILMGVGAAAFAIVAATTLLVKNVAAPFFLAVLQEKFGTPSLFSDTNWKRDMFGNLQLVTNSDWPVWADLVYPPTLKDLLNSYKYSLINSIKTDTPFLNVCFWGAPGTGKTAAARLLATDPSVNMLYSFMSGGDVQKMLKTGKAPEQLQQAINTAKKLGKKMIIFIDEAEAAFPDRGTGNVSQELQAFITTFLNLTGTESKDISFIFATNHPRFLDAAIRSRVSMFIEFPLPSETERASILKANKKKHFSPKYKIKGIKYFDDELILRLAKETPGFSGRDLSYLTLFLQKQAMQTKNRTMSLEMLLKNAALFIEMKRKEHDNFGHNNKPEPVISGQSARQPVFATA